MIPTANGKPAHAPFAQHTAERCAPAAIELPAPPDLRPYGGRLAESLTEQESRLVDVLLEHVLGHSLDVLMEHLSARFDAVDRRLARLGHLGLISSRDPRRPAPRPADTQPAPSDPPFDPDPEPESDPGPAQVPPPAENRDEDGPLF